MNTNNENEKPKEAREAREARNTAPAHEPFEAEPKPGSEGADLRETVEGGYGWGV